MRVEGVFVAGLGSYLPDPVSTAEAVALGHYDQAECTRGGWLAAAVAGDLPAPEMAVRAAHQALSRSEHHPDEIDVLMHATVLPQGPDGWSPHHYVQRYTIGGDAPAFEIRQTCNGVLGAIELASCFLAADPGRVAALITGADNFGSPLVDRWHYLAGANTNRGSIFGDAGTAIVLSRRSGFARLRAVGSASMPDLEEMYRGDQPLFPPDCTVGRPMRIGARVAEFASRHPKAFADAKQRLQATRTALAQRTLAEAGVCAAEVTRATHVFSGGEEYIRSVLAPLGIDPSRGMLEFGRRLGHLGVNDHVAALTHLVETGAVGPGDHVLMLGNGAGIALSSAVVEILDRPDWAVSPGSRASL